MHLKKFFVITLIFCCFWLVKSPVQALTICQAIQVDADDPQAFLPDPNCTPGVINPDVTQENIYTTICKSGYTATIRPPASYTNKLKKQQIAEYGYTDTELSSYEEDHLISLELGGDPKAPQNLWPEPHPSINEKDTLENELHKKICNGELTLAQAQDMISHNWYQAYRQHHPAVTTPTDLWEQLWQLVRNLLKPVISL